MFQMNYWIWSENAIYSRFSPKLVQDVMVRNVIQFQKSMTMRNSVEDSNVITRKSSNLIWNKVNNLSVCYESLIMCHVGCCFSSWGLIVLNLMSFSFRLSFESIWNVQLCKQTQLNKFYVFCSPKFCVWYIIFCFGLSHWYIDVKTKLKNQRNWV